MLAKMASSIHKPNEQTILRASVAFDFLSSFKVENVSFLWFSFTTTYLLKQCIQLPGIGHRITEEFHSMDVKFVHEMRKLTLETLKEK